VARNEQAHVYEEEDDIYDIMLNQVRPSRA
jgi:hypothetical protein